MLNKTGWLQFILFEQSLRKCGNKETTQQDDNDKSKLRNHSFLKVNNIFASLTCT